MKGFKRLLALVLTTGITAGLLPMEAMAAQVQAHTGYTELSDEYLSVKVSNKNGGFLIDTKEGDKKNKADDNRFLLYPDEFYDTSYTSFRVTREGVAKDYIFGRDYGFLGQDSSGVDVTTDANGISAQWSVDGLTFTQRITLLDPADANHGMARIGYSVQNTGAAVEKLEARILLDTALGYRDDAVYRTFDANSVPVKIENECILTDPKQCGSVLFATTEQVDPNQPKDPNAVRAYTAHGDKKPTQIAIGHWNNLAQTVFDFVPDPAMTFTNPYNKEYLTADSAYALYYDLGAVEGAQAAATQMLDTYYGVYSNREALSNPLTINFASVPTAMELERQGGPSVEGIVYTKPAGGGLYGDFTLAVDVTSYAEEPMSAVRLAFYLPKGILPYKLGSDTQLDETVDMSNPYTVQITNLQPGQEVRVEVRLHAAPENNTEYRNITVSAFDVKDHNELLDSKLLGSAQTSILCPGREGELPTFLSINPQVIYTSGTRHLYLAGQNFGVLENAELVLHPVSAGQDKSRDVSVPRRNRFWSMNEGSNSLDMVLDRPLTEGTWQVVFTLEDRTVVTSEALQFQVSPEPIYYPATYGVLAVIQKKHGDAVTNTLRGFASEADYLKAFPQPRIVSGPVGDRTYTTVQLVYRGSFSLEWSDATADAYITKAEGTALSGAASTITINNCIDVEDGQVTIEVDDDKTIHTSIDGKVYTTGARTKVWNGVCAITDIKAEEEYVLTPYSQTGTQIDMSNANSIMLIWPGAASTAQTIAGVILEFRYCEFGLMKLEGSGTSDEWGAYTGNTQHVVAFGAQMSPNLLVPRNFDYGHQETSMLEKAQLKLASSNYTASQLVEVQNRYQKDQEAWEKSKEGTLSLYVHNILFGGGFIGFDTTIEVGVPSYSGGMPPIEGSLHLKVMNDEWEFGLQGKAEIEVLTMDATLKLRSYNGIPVPDSLYFYVGGFLPGINIDGYGIFWVNGAGGGFDKMYETIFPVSAVPPLTLMISGGFSLFTVLEARADLSVSLRGVSAYLRDMNIAGLSLIPEMGIEIYWYPRIKLNASIDVDILGIIVGNGYLLLLQQENGEFFWEGFATAELKIPDSVLFIGGTKLGGADLGVNAERIWGAIHVLKIDAGVTYYWGGDVEFAFGKYDYPEATTPGTVAMLQDLPVSYDPETGRTLYMRVANARLMGSSTDSGAGTTAVSKVKITSANGNMTHTFTMPNGDEDGLVNVSMPAIDEIQAEKLAKQVEVAYGAATQTLTWMDNTKAANHADNANADARWSYDAVNHRVNVALSLTGTALGQGITIKTPVAAELLLVGMKRLAKLESVTGDLISATVTGKMTNAQDKVTVYAVEKIGEEYGKNWELGSYTGSFEGAKTIALTTPPEMPSGNNYILKAVGTTADQTSNPIVEGTGTLSHTNANQPAKPSLTDAKLGGDYTIDVTLSNADSNAKVDDPSVTYLATVYEKTQKDDKVEWTPTIFANTPVDLNMIKTGILTLGGQTSTTLYNKRVDIMDSEGKTTPKEKRATAQEALDDQGQLKDGYTRKEVTQGLEAGKTYRIGLTAVKDLKKANSRSAEQGLLRSEEGFSTEVVMVAPQDTKVTLKAQSAQALFASYALDDGATAQTDTVNSQDVNITVSVVDGTLAPGATWTLDDDGILDKTALTSFGRAAAPTGPQSYGGSGPINLTGLSEGTHILEFRGENTHGDAVHEMYSFTVDTLAPRLQLASDQTTGFYEGTTVTLKGFSEKGAVLHAQVGSQSQQDFTVTEADGSFQWTITLADGLAFQELTLWATDQVDNRSPELVLPLTNVLVSQPGAHGVLYRADGTKVTSAIGATEAGGTQLQLWIENKEGTKAVRVDPDTAAGGRVTWNLAMNAGTGSLSDTGLLQEVNDLSVGMVMATLDQLTAAAALNESDGSAAQQSVALPKFTPNGGSFTGSQTVTITCATEGAQIYYTLDGTQPTAGSTIYTGPFTISESKTVKAIAVKDGLVSSAIEEASFVKQFSGSGSSGGNGPRYSITLPSETGNGSLTVTPKAAQAGDTVTVTATPDAGHVLDHITVTDRNGKPVTVTENNGLYTFVMPIGGVKLTADFKEGKTAYTDVPEKAWYAEAVDYVTSHKLMNGVSGNQFAPHGILNRAMVVTILYRMENEPTPSKNSSFTDVRGGQWYTDPVRWAAENKIINGYTPTLFGPEDPISREQLCTILYRYAEWKKLNVAGSADLSGFHDRDQISSWAESGVEWAHKEGLIRGVSATELDPAGGTQRCQAATVFMRLCKDLMKLQ